MTALETYNSIVQRDFSTGQTVKETLYYPHLSSLFNEIRKALNPQVFCVVHISNRGAGLPDGVFLSASQKRTAEKSADAKVKETPLRAMLLERGVRRRRSAKPRNF